LKQKIRNKTKFNADFVPQTQLFSNEFLEDLIKIAGLNGRKKD